MVAIQEYISILLTDSSFSNPTPEIVTPYYLINSDSAFLSVDQKRYISYEYLQNELKMI